MEIDRKKVLETALELEKTMNERELLELCSLLLMGVSGDLSKANNDTRKAD